MTAGVGLLFAMIFGSILLLIIILPIYLLSRGMDSGKSHRNEASDQEEAEIIQDLHRMATRMESRIDSLETIMMDSKSSSGAESGRD